MQLRLKTYGSYNLKNMVHMENSTLKLPMKVIHIQGLRCGQKHIGTLPILHLNMQVHKAIAYKPSHSDLTSLVLCSMTISFFLPSFMSDNDNYCFNRPANGAHVALRHDHVTN
jgi:hypothetical protein